MAVVVKMPKLGLNEEENVLGEWYVSEGDKVAEGDKLFSIETDKSTMDIYAEQAGTVLRCLYGELDVIPVMSGVCIIGEPGEDVGGQITGSEAIAVQEGRPSAVGTKELRKEEAAPIPLRETSVIPQKALAPKVGPVSPRARKLAAANSVELRGIRPSGAEGRIVEEDVLHAMKAAPQPSAPELVNPPERRTTSTAGGRTMPTTKIRRLIGENMMHSLRSTAQTTQNMRYNASKLQNYRAWLKNAPGPEKDISLHGLISYITVRTLMKYDYMNAHMYAPEEITVFEAVNLGCAVGTPKGLLVPTVKDAQSMNLGTFAAALKDSIQRAKDGRLQPAEMTGATFTISNLGAYGITTFNPILNPPQVAILGVGTIDYAVKNTPEGILHYPAGYLSLTYDHRAMDGVPAVEFLGALRDNLESMELLLGE